MKPTTPRLFQATRALLHENPLGLPPKGTPPRFQRGLPTKRPIRSVSKVIAVSSAKGGVGKSTIASNLSLAFARLGLRAGILDTDVFGPSIPTLFNLSGEPELSAQNQLVPLTAYGVQTMSIGYLVPPSSAVVWRGPMLLKAVQQLLHEVDWGAKWGGLDVLVLDLPPGTGDTQLSITQQVVLDGAVIVTTPHTLAVVDAVKGVDMFGKVGVPLLGLVQNMSVFCCPGCGSETAVFGTGEKVKGICKEHGMEFLGDVPLHPNIGEDASQGKPTVVAEPESSRALVFMDVARKIGRKIGLDIME
ncbi:P-loop containing nucleoside triphosphate hydrolase protein [Podospora aff. communis PSN243]|uniref:P-loop containing nucleoside triphosphate hydrolase protein n=1 Tax=Podospora aff. communis PSN243 TaxID=3040156 RepID=A0AAV9H327_9PEZI|nr:P-loop containing nucleoside triphosphate hydrolase protein [Podospora aff. communis PSN243]